jgi:hypothetical protein
MPGGGGGSVMSLIVGVCVSRARTDAREYATSRRWCVWRSEAACAWDKFNTYDILNAGRPLLVRAPVEDTIIAAVERQICGRLRDIARELGLAQPRVLWVFCDEHLQFMQLETSISTLELVFNDNLVKQQIPIQPQYNEFR